MPYVKKTTRRYKKAGRGRRRVTRARTGVGTVKSSAQQFKRNMYNPRTAVSGFPNQLTVTLPYTTNARINPGAGQTGSDYIYAINSAFDPDVTAGGHQPRGFDEWSAIYAQYRVSKVSAYMTIRQRAAHGIGVSVICNNVSTALGATADILEYNNVQYLGSTSSNVRPLQKKITVYPHKVLGQKWSQYIGSDTTKALISASPSEIGYMHIVAQQIDQVTDCDYEFEIILYYKVTFFDRTNLPAS